MTKVTWGLGSIIGTAATAAALLLTIIAGLQEQTALLGIPAWFWLGTTAVLGATVVFGRMWQSGRGVQQPVKWGFASALGYLGTLAGVLTPFISDLAGALDPLGVPQAVWIAASAVLLVVTTLGRMDQGSKAEPAVLEAVEMESSHFAVPSAEEIGAAVAKALRTP